MPSKFLRVLPALLKLFFRLLYHEFAWTYDAVAALVSVGGWKSWGRVALEFLEGGCILEIGFGPGHLQAAMQHEGWAVFGLDASPQMARISQRRLRRLNMRIRLVIGRVQYLPYPDSIFDRAISTFPSEYIFDPASLAELRRVIRPGGTLVIIPAAWITGKSLLHRFWHWIFRVTYQTPASTSPEMLERISEPFQRAGFIVSTEMFHLETADVLVILARNPG